MNALNLAALKRQLRTLSDEYSGLSPQVAAQIAADALEVIGAAERSARTYRELYEEAEREGDTNSSRAEAAEAKLATLEKIAHDYSGTTVTDALKLIDSAVQS